MSKLGGIIRVFGYYKYYLVIIAGVVLIGFVGEHSIVNRLKYRERINELQDEIDTYQSAHERDTRQLRLMDRDPKMVEKIARERYFMKADDEDIFVLSSDMEKNEPYAAQKDSDKTAHGTETAETAQQQ